jgi:hypothetical protein
MPTAAPVFPSAGHAYAVYELYLTNFSGDPQKIPGIEVLDAGRRSSVGRWGPAYSGN